MDIFAEVHSPPILPIPITKTRPTVSLLLIIPITQTYSSKTQHKPKSSRWSPNQPPAAADQALVSAPKSRLAPAVKCLRYVYIEDHDF